ncbi:glycosyltransferase family 2 protein [Sporolactobacillus putidus]|uniref:Glycosyl transferase n=1 Tax=Sporolactobacillus putidus TaxID=492735 RepID=A0A917RYU2_9BACL|nr:glycosyltransferase family 2 protein [Sporolactobacillus putidus]GGL45375.1 glycosyl transferase [Sporolactobacillus putidus]
MNIAVLIPCYNEELTIGKVIGDFKRELPEADLYVYDNNSTDKTSEIARESGAIVVEEYRQGKGNVVRSMFFDIDADYYVMVDGDDTYPAEAVHELIEPLISGRADMTIGDRLSNGTYENENKRAFHNFGNTLVKSLINRLYQSRINDIMTGYRGFNRLFVRSFPVTSTGFEIETELSIHSLDKRFKIEEIPIDYRDRPSGSESKLNTFSDGIKVIKTIFTLFKDYKPLEFFSIWAALLAVLSLVAGIPVIAEFVRFHYIYKVPSAVLAVGLMLMAMLSLVCGLVLDTVVSNARKQYEMELHRIYDLLRTEHQLEKSRS